MHIPVGEGRMKRGPTSEFWARLCPVLSMAGHFSSVPEELHRREAGVSEMLFGQGLGNASVRGRPSCPPSFWSDCIPWNQPLPS